MSYALFDEQTGGYMHTGYGAETLEELKDALLSYIEVDLEEEDQVVRAWPVEQIAGAWDFRIEKGNFKREDS